MGYVRCLVVALASKPFCLKKSFRGSFAFPPLQPVSYCRWSPHRALYGAGRQALMKAQLERIVNTEGLSENVYEIVSKSLE